MKLILACEPSGGIGLNNRLPWSSLEGDLSRFKKLTSNQTVIMGRKTWESLPKSPLPNRYNVVISKNKLDLPLGVHQIYDTAELCRWPLAWLIGGASIIEQSWDWIYEVHLSKTFDYYDCDVYTNLDNLRDFNLVETSRHSDHEYQVWKRK